MKSWALLLGGATLALAASVGSASATVYDFSLFDTANDFGQNGPSDYDVASGQFTVVGGVITNVTGTFDGFAITGASAYAGSDNVLNPGPDYGDYGGISFSVANGNSYNITDFLGPEALLSSSTDAGGNGSDPSLLRGFTVSAVPEPATWMLFLMGFGGLGFMMRSRRRQLSGVAAV